MVSRWNYFSLWKTILNIFDFSLSYTGWSVPTQTPNNNSNNNKQNCFDQHNQDVYIYYNNWIYNWDLSYYNTDIYENNLIDEMMFV